MEVAEKGLNRARLVVGQVIMHHGRPSEVGVGGKQFGGNETDSKIDGGVGT